MKADLTAGERRERALRYASYGLMVLFAGAVWPMIFAPLCYALEKRVY